MPTLIFASSNLHKAKEIQAALPEQMFIQTMREAGYEKEIPEPFDTLEENAKHKAFTVHLALAANCFAEDTGLETEALNGAPGVYSARYAGEPANDQRNIAKLLTALDNKPSRSARFKTVIVLYLEGKEYVFTGLCEGSITQTPSGVMGFGYDPVFIPNGASKTFAEMTIDEKNQYSHRKKAVSKMIDFLEKKYSKH